MYSYEDICKPISFGMSPSRTVTPGGYDVEVYSIRQPGSKPSMASLASSRPPCESRISEEIPPMPRKINEEMLKHKEEMKQEVPPIPMKSSKRIS
jgi:hypothetical protein